MFTIPQSDVSISSSVALLKARSIGLKPRLAMPVYKDSLHLELDAHVHNILVLPHD